MNYLHSFILVAWACHLLQEHHPHHSSSTPAQPLGSGMIACLPSCRYSFPLTQGTACVHSFAVRSYTLPYSISILLLIYGTVLAPSTLPASYIHYCVPLHPYPRCCVQPAPHLHSFCLSISASFKLAGARQEDCFLIHPHYQQSASRSEQPCQLLRNETIASIW